MRLPAILFALVALQGQAQTWQQLPDFPGTPRDDAASFLIGDHIHVGTGMEVGWGLTNDWWRFNMQDETWEQMASLPASARQYACAFSLDGIGYLFGGLDASGALNELWAYDPQQDLWTARAPLPAEARSACVAGEGFGYGIVATGMLASGMPTNEAWKYHPASDEWEAMAPVPGPARHRAAAYAGTGGLVIAGGADQQFNALADVHWYPVFFETGDWYPDEPMPAARYGHRGAAFGVLAGGASETFTLHGDVWRHFLGSWQTMPTFPPGARRGGVAAGTEDISTSRFYFGLGLQPLGSDYVRMNDWWKLTYATGIVEHSPDALQLHPNPAGDLLYLRVTGAWAGAWVDIVDLTGRPLHTGLPANAPLDVRGLAPGRYLVHMRHRDGRSLRAPFIKLE
jgi:hypothetical protein